MKIITFTYKRLFTEYVKQLIAHFTFKNPTLNSGFYLICNESFR